MLFKYVLQIFLFVCVFYLTNAQSKSQCNAAEDCGKCIQTGSECHWCISANFTEGARCDLLSTFNNTCNETTEAIKTAEAKNIEDNPFGDDVQVRPQTVQLDVRPGQPATFELKVKPRANFPVDIYYLMDVSFSMRDDLQNLKTLGGAIANEIKDITSKYRFAFGSFVDKAALPYVQPKDLHPTFPCTHSNIVSKNISCRAVFSYIHFFNFSQDATAFEEVVGSQKISGDGDGPEGGFDGFMQASVCEKIIGWRPKGKARRIILYVTDALPKIAGDAKLAGIVTPNDGKCHMEIQANGEIQDMNSETMDYPSIFHLKEVMKENQIVPILAVTKGVIDTYQAIKKEWEDLGAEIDELSSDSSNIVKLVKDTYEKISSTVRLTNDKLDNFKISYELVKCDQGDPSKPNQCPDVKISQEVVFKVTVDALKCPDDGKAFEQLKIRIAGFGEVLVNVTYKCDCTCKSNSIEKSPLCSGEGTFECGICKCDPNRYGSQCQCSLTDLGNEGNNTAPCIAPDNSTCSGQGTCLCGKCDCDKQSDTTLKIEGRFCECKNFDCPRYEGRECGGSERSTSCQCGKCICKEIYQGHNCGEFNCDGVKKNICTKDGKECNDHGRCECDKGKCECDAGYTGPNCETCETKECRCADLENCVLCKFFGRTDMDCTGCDIYFFQPSDLLITEERCTAQLNKTCVVYFSSKLGFNQTISVQEEPNCAGATSESDDPDLLAIILGIIAGILILGLLLLLLWKLITHIHDKGDYEKFKKSQQDSQWEKGGNPIYREPNQQFANPSYAGDR